jgi:hypothetical protein
MDVVDLKTRILLVRLYYENGSSAAAALRKFKTMNNLRDDPFPARFVERLINKFETHGVVTDLPKSGRPRTSDEQVQAVEESLQSGQSTSHLGIFSARAITRDTGIPKTTVLRVLKTRLKMRPYRLRMLHELKEGDHQERIDFANWFLEQEDDYVERILWSDEAHFHLDGSLSTRNCVIWSSSNPQAAVIHSMHPQRVTVWCGFTAKFILPPAFIEGETVNGERYLRILQEHMLPNLPRRKSVVFMQDGAPPHIAKPVKEFLMKKFGDDIISRHFPRQWPPRSPDLNPCDFFLWGYLREKVFLRHPTTLAEIKNAIAVEIAMIDKDLLYRAVDNMFDRLLSILSVNGSHIE